MCSPQTTAESPTRSRSASSPPFADQFERDVGGPAFVLLDEHHHVVLA